MADYKPLGQPRIKGGQFPHQGKSIEYKPKHPSLDEFEDEVGAVYAELMKLLLSKHDDYGPKILLMLLAVLLTACVYECTTS